MKKFILGAALSLVTVTSVFAANTDLVLQDERWFGKFTKYVCDDGNTEASEAPAELADYAVEFGHIGTDYSLDNFIIKATFVEDGSKCSYSAFLTADNAAWTIALNESRAFAVEGLSTCEAGKALIDQILSFNNYKYLHGRAAIYSTFSNADVACGDATGKVGIHFQVLGRR